MSEDSKKSEVDEWGDMIIVVLVIVAVFFGVRSCIHSENREDGYRQGYYDGKGVCRKTSTISGPRSSKRGNKAYMAGYNDGFLIGKETCGR